MMRITPEALAAKIGCSFSTVQNMLRGKRVNANTAHRAAEELGIDIRKLAPESVPSHRASRHQAKAV